MEYLHDEQYYIDRYDLHTIEECLDYFRSIKDRFNKEKKTHFAKYTEEKFQQEINKCLNLMLFILKGERYRHKKETIRDWMGKDKQMQEMYDNTPPPQNIRCKACGSPTIVTLKNLHLSHRPDNRMTFMFACVKCDKRQVLYEDGTEWKYDPPKCPKCKYPLKTDLKIKGDITTYTSGCVKCGYKNKDVDDHGKFRQEQEAKEKKDKELLKKYRKDFCLSDKDGQEYLENMDILEYATKVKNEEISKYDNSVYQKSIRLKKLSIVELEKLLSEKLEKKNYIKLSFDKPEMGQLVIVPFSAQDANTSRKGYDSANELRKLIKITLEDTNWRLMSDDISYRLGYVTGKLKGVESEEDFLELAGKRKEAKPSKEDEEKRSKYQGNKMVQLARLMGEMEGIERMRKKRLAKEPEGFLLEATEGPYSCRVCGEMTPGDKAWWDLNGIKCLDCQRNIKEGIVPLEFFEDDYGDDVVVKDWMMKSYYGVHPATVRKLRREGLLKGRDLRRQDGTVYETLYVVNENQEFFKKYPKIEPKIKILDGGKNKKQI